MNEKWQPSCTKEVIIARSKLYNKIRSFFAKRDVIEVETPLLSIATVTDPFIASFEVYEPLGVPKANNQESSKLYLQTSPEFAMKRMLCAGIGSIYQICKAFRAEEQGLNHNREFTMLEWYRVGFDLDGLMQEMQELLLDIFNLTTECLKISYTDLFKQYLEFNHNDVDITFLKNKIKELFDSQFDSILDDNNFDNLYHKDDLLMILISNYIEPKLDKNIIYFIYDYPKSQAALARVDESGVYPVAKRFEVYFQGFELANGYHELADYQEQQARFERDVARRKQLNLPLVNIDKNLIEALKHGLPDCSGVAMGLDRILMILLSTQNIANTLTFR